MRKFLLSTLFIAVFFAYGFSQTIVQYHSSSYFSFFGSGTSSLNFTGNSTNHNHNSTGHIKFQVVNAGTIYINSSVSSESSYDYANVYVNGSNVWHQSGTTSWGWHSYSVSPGQIIEFRYTKDGSVSNGYDEQTFQLYSNNNSSAQLNSISPNSGDQGQTLSVSISGTNMNYGSQWSGTLSNFRFSQWSGSNMFYGNSTSTSGNNLYGSVSISSNQNTGWYDLEVYNQNTGNWVQKSSAFYVDYSAPVAQINSISPNSGDQGQTLSVSISGTNMNYGSQWSGTLSDFRFSQWSGSNMFYGNPTSTSGNNLYGSVSISSNQNTGWYDLEVYNQNTNQWVQKSSAFFVNYTAPVAQINSISPNSGDQGQTLSVSISGTNMNYGNQWSGTLSNFRFSQWSGSNMFYGNPTSTSGNNLYGSVNISSGQNTGWYDLEVYNQNTGNWVQKSSAFEVISSSGVIFVSGNNLFGVHGSCSGSWYGSSPQVVAEAVCQYYGYPSVVSYDVNSTATGFNFYGQWNLFYSASFNASYMLAGGIDWGYANGYYACGSLPGVYNVGCSSAGSPPAIYSISPNSGDQGQTLSVSISGNNMNYGSQWSGTLSDFRFSQWSGSNMFYGTSTSESGNYLYGDVSIPNGQNTGYYDLEVYDQTSSNWIMLNNAFEVLPPPPPSITSISPNYGDQGQTLSVSISGTNINYGNQWSGTLSDFRFSQWSGSNMFYGNPTSTSGNYLYGDVSIPSGQNTGYYDLEVYDQNIGQWIQKNSAFYVSQENNIITPDSAEQGQTLQVFISGNNQYEFENWSGCGSWNNGYWGSMRLESNSGNNNITITNNAYYWQYNSSLGSYGFYTNLSIPSSADIGTYDLQVDNDCWSYTTIAYNAFTVTDVLGCMDSTADNYNTLAGTDDGSCYYCNISNMLYYTSPSSITACDGFAMANTSSNYPITSYNWVNSSGSPVSTSNIATNLCNDAYIYTAIDSAGCIFIDTIIIGTAYGCTDNSMWNYNPMSNVDDGSCIPFIYGCTDPSMFNYNASANTEDSSCVPYIYGCIDSTAYNYDVFANTNNGSCQYCDLSVSLFVSQNSSSSACDGWAFANYMTSNSPVTYLWSNGSTSNSVIGLCTGVYSITVTDAVGCTATDSLYIGIVTGCTDSTANNYDSTASVDDGSCTYTSACANPSPTGAYISELIHDRARVNWDNMNDANCMVNQYRIRYREIGSSSWSSKTMSGSGLCMFGLNTTSKKILGLTASTTYEYYMKAWYCGGGVSGWSAIQNFTTLDLCPNVINFAVSTPTNTKASFTWDTISAYSFARIKLRPDVTGGVWTTAGGFGVFYPALTKPKNGLTPGQAYRASARTWCDPSGGAYRSDAWTSPIFWTQPNAIRVEGGTVINNLAIYPNPSRDIFNVSFTSDTKQDLRVRIMNVIGEEVINDNLEQFIGEYTKQINLSDNAKGIYFLEIKTNDGIINKKLILQ